MLLKDRLSGLRMCTVVCIQAAIYFSKEPKSQDALHGRSAMLRCEVSGPADVRYGWLHNGEPVLDSERRFQEGSNLKFTAVDRHLDAGAFQCVATDAESGEEARSNNASFNIKCADLPSKSSELNPTACHWQPRPLVQMQDASHTSPSHL
ncbi:hypothetical protein ACEWY4_020592 [Coilia grayii]|uniref:Ig-like domain-containing protein n=1 Tax=Coilia grayii TaxID=363190 RepID=A0ABD1J6M1_9TELE